MQKNMRLMVTIGLLVTHMGLCNRAGSQEPVDVIRDRVSGGGANELLNAGALPGYRQAVRDERQQAIQAFTKGLDCGDKKDWAGASGYFKNALDLYVSLGISKGFVADGKHPNDRTRSMITVSLEALDKSYMWGGDKATRKRMCWTAIWGRVNQFERDCETALVKPSIRAQVHREAEAIDEVLNYWERHPQGQNGMWYDSVEACEDARQRLNKSISGVNSALKESGVEIKFGP